MVRQPSNLVQIPIALEFTESNKKEVCSICLGEFSEKSKKYSLKKCNHTYHVSCIKLYFKMKVPNPILFRSKIDVYLCNAPKLSVLRNHKLRISK